MHGRVEAARWADGRDPAGDLPQVLHVHNRASRITRLPSQVTNGLSPPPRRPLVPTVPPCMSAPVVLRWQARCAV